MGSAKLQKWMIGVALASFLGAPSFAYDCEVRISQDTHPALTFSSWTRNVPTFQESGSTTFEQQAYAEWIGYVPLLPFAFEWANMTPSRTQKCMKSALERTFSSEAATQAIFEELLDREPGLDAKAQFCLRGSAMPTPESSTSMGAGVTLPFKFSARKVSNRNNWQHEIAHIHPPKSLCAKYYPPECSSAPPAPAQPDPGSSAEPSMGIDTFDDIIGGDSAQTMGDYDDNDGSSAPSGSNDAPPPPPEPEYCDPLPYTPPVERVISSWSVGSADWTGSSRTTTGHIDDKVADFNQDGRDDLLPSHMAYVYSIMPLPGVENSCVTADRPDRPGGFGSIPTGSNIGHYLACIDGDNRRSMADKIKVAKTSGDDIRLVLSDGAGWSQFEPMNTAQWTSMTIPSFKTLTWDDRANVPIEARTLPANMSAYKMTLHSSAAAAENLRVGDFFADGVEDAFLTYDYKWWVSNDFTQPWVIVADGKHMAEWDVSIEHDSSTDKSTMSGTRIMPSAPRATPPRRADVEVDTRTRLRTRDNKAIAAPASEIAVARPYEMDISLSAFDGANMQLGDLTGDDRTDVFVSHKGAWFVFDGAGGTFKRLQITPIPADDTRLADIDGDGKDDVVTIEAGRLVYYAQGLGQAIDMVGAANAIDKIAFGDFNGDGKDDLMTAIEP